MKKSNIFLFSKTPYPEINHIPVIQTSYIHNPIDFSSYDYIIASSKEVFPALDEIGEWKDLPVLAISESTAQCARDRGAEILAVAKGYGREIVALVKEKYAGKKALYPHAKKTAYDIQSDLLKEGIEVDSRIVYQTRCSEHEKVCLPEDAICIFTSPSAVECFLKNYNFLPSYRVVCIGKTTAAALPEKVKYQLSKNNSIASTVESAFSLLK